MLGDIMTSNKSILGNVFMCAVGLIVVTWWCLGDPSRSIYLPGNAILLTGVIFGLLMYKGDYNKNYKHAIGALILVLVLMWIVIFIMLSQGYTIYLVTSGIITTLASVFITYFELKKWKKSQKESGTQHKTQDNIK
jgi:O-antigen/teichoic acid export membrane protein